MSYEFLRLERSGHLATITFNRPEKLNALSRGFTRELNAALDEVAAEFPDIRVLILTGEGRGFCSGADVGGQAESIDRPPGSRPQPTDGDDPKLYSIPHLAPHIRRIPQAVIAAVNGVAAGAGLSIALASDIRIASEVARFSCLFIKRSLVPDAAASYTIAAVAGVGVAAEMALTGGIYNAEWAYRVGLVNRLVPADKLMDEARSLGEEIASNPPLCIKATKHLLYSWGPEMGNLVEVELEANAPMNGSEDKREAVVSFVEKRAPVYKGR